MIAENVVLTTDNDGHNYYVDVDRIAEFGEWCDSEPDEDFEHGTRFDGECFVVNIIRKL